MFPWVIIFTVFCGGPLDVEALGNCPVCPSLNPALFTAPLPHNSDGSVYRKASRQRDI